jgi:PAS domain S-box-containing protein
VIYFCIFVQINEAFSLIQPCGKSTTKTIKNMSDPIRILIVEDNQNDVELAQREINHVLKSCEFASLETREDFLNSLKNFRPDLIITDFNMPNFDGMSVITLTQQYTPFIPVIILTGSIDEETAAESVKAGAVDYVIKENIIRLRQAVLNALEKKQMWKERLQAEEKLRASEERYRLISTVTSDYMFSTIVDSDGKLNLDWVAGAFEKISGYTIEEFKAIGGWRATIHPDDMAKDKTDMANLLANRTVVTEIRTIKKSGEIIWVKVYAHPVWDQYKNRLAGIYGAVQDISERKKAEEETKRLNKDLEKLVKERTKELESTNIDLQNEITERLKAEENIKQQLAEKEVLLKEVHHRVKNNMQVIISILNLQASFVKDKKFLNILQDSQSRIKTMSLIHEKLYQTKDLTNINFSEYITNLLKYLFTSYQSSEQKVEYEINIGSFPVDIDTTISLGLITNELVSNSFKYAFANIANCKIDVSLKKFDIKNLVLSIKDNGKGLPSGFDYKNTESLGLQLVCLLTEQIQGKLEVKSSDKGTTFSIIFPGNN